jgi:hypothetical protein
LAAAEAAEATEAASAGGLSPAAMQIDASAFVNDPDLDDGPGYPTEEDAIRAAMAENPLLVRSSSRRPRKSAAKASRAVRAAAAEESDEHGGDPDYEDRLEGEGEEEDQRPAKQAKSRFQETPARAKSRAVDAAAYRQRAFSIVNHTQTACERVRVCYPGTLTVADGVSKSGAAIKTVIPNPQNGKFKKFTSKAQVVNASEGIFKQIATLVEVGKTNTDRLKQCIITACCNGDEDRLQDWLTANNFIDAFESEAGALNVEEGA